MSFNYDAASGPLSRPWPQGLCGAYRRFDTAAEAIRFAIEELPPPLLVGAYLQVEDERFDSDQIRELYRNAAYPLERLG